MNPLELENDLEVLKSTTYDILKEGISDIRLINLSIYFWSRTISTLERTKVQRELVREAVKLYDSLLQHRAKIMASKLSISYGKQDTSKRKLQPLGTYGRRTLYLLQELGSPILGEEIIEPADEEVEQWFREGEKERKYWAEKLDTKTKPTLVPLFSTSQHTLELLEKLKNKVVNQD